MGDRIVAAPPAAQAHALAARALAAQAQVLAAQAQPPATQAQALATQAHALAAQAQVLATQAQPPAAQAHALATHALAAQAQALAARAQVLAAQAQPPADQAQALADQAQALATQAQVLTTQAQPPAAQVHALAAHALADQAQVLAAQVQPPATQAQPPATQAQALATLVHALAAQAQVHAAQAQVLAAQALVAHAAQAHALAAQALAAQAQVLAAQAQPPAAQAQALATLAHALATQADVLAAQVLVAPNYDPNETIVHAYKEIVILQDINLHYPFHKLALEDWERKVKYLSKSISSREGQSNDLTNQIYSIFGIYAVFQGVVLSAVSQLKQTAHPESGGMPVCGKIWFPIVLTGFATFATLVGIRDKFRSLELLESTIHKERQPKIELADRAKCLRREGPQNFKFHLHADNSRPATKPKSVKKRVLVYVFFVIFLGICILSYFVILCDTWVFRKWDGGLHR